MFTAYIFRPEMYQLSIYKLKELFEENRKLQQFSPLSDYEGQEEEMNGTKMKFGKRNNSRGGNYFIWKAEVISLFGL